MQLYPAIDLKGGQCVRLTQGLFDQAKIYSSSPADVAARWQQLGGTYLHLVDLDGALAGRSVNEEAIKGIVSRVSIPVQLGGGIRTAEAAAYMLQLGVTRVIIGTRAARNPEFMRDLVKEYGPERVVAGIDAKNGRVALEGWETVSDMTAIDLCRRMKEYGVRHVVYTDIAKDGMMAGPNVEATQMLTEETGMDIIASGGVSSLEDLERLKACGIRGAIIGKALYEGAVDLSEAVRRFQLPCIRRELKTAGPVGKS